MISYGHEIIFIDDGSSDRSVAAIQQIARNDPAVRIIEFTRNFGKEIATSAGLRFCQGAAAIILDADLQHPIDLIPDFIKKWEQDIPVVIGVRTSAGYDSVFRRIGSWLFYKIMNAISETEIVPNATDFRLLDRSVIEEFNHFTERNRLTRGLIDWLGFRTEYIHFIAEPRQSGQARYNYLKLIKLAVSTFVSHSLFPLKLAGYIGVLITFFSGCLGLFMLITEVWTGDPWQLDFSGPALLAALNLFLIGIVLSCLGLVALYIGNIHAEVINRPLYVVKTAKKIIL